MVSYSFSMPVPFSGGSISKEKAVFSLLCIRSIILISFSLSLFGEQNLFVHWEQKYEKEMRYAFFYWAILLDSVWKRPYSKFHF